ncbi:hypothetical protein Q5N41_10660 [Vibrio cholerae]|uniref:hypothetical protein n=1 Tax=Vibrio cholerae TaxID=666 RepID=UPI0029344B8D|nr:hypothetical protein [Vibrio cholerae]MDV2378846.1 hypothetical protein [Vibrio cholerae]
MSDIINKLRDVREKSELNRLKSELLKEQQRLEKWSNALNEREHCINEFSQYEARDVEYHSQSYAAFFGTRMEKDKSILTLAVVGIGYLATFANLGDEKLIGLELILFCVASLCFLVSIVIVIQVFKINGDYIIAVLNSARESQKKAELLSKRLKAADRIVLGAFIFGLITTISLGYIASGI